MAPQLYLITPSAPDLERFPRQLMAVLTGPEVSAILVRRGDLADTDYSTLVQRLVQIGQAAGAAVLVEDDWETARRAGADGVHITTGGTDAIRAAMEAIKPNGIIGVGNVRSRHDAMSFGELDIDYLMFGPLSGEPDDQAFELAHWWADTFEIPSVLSDPGASAADAQSVTSEFLALSDCIWTSADPVAAFSAFDRALKSEA